MLFSRDEKVHRAGGAPEVIVKQAGQRGLPVVPRSPPLPALPRYPAPHISPAERGGHQTVKLGQLFCAPGERGYVRRQLPRDRPLLFRGHPAMIRPAA